MNRDESRTPATSKVGLFVIIGNGWEPLTIITKSSTSDVTAVLDPPLMNIWTLSRTSISKCLKKYILLHEAEVENRAIFGT